MGPRFISILAASYPGLDLPWAGGMQSSHYILVARDHRPCLLNGLLGGRHVCVLTCVGTCVCGRAPHFCRPVHTHVCVAHTSTSIKIRVWASAAPPGTHVYTKGLYTHSDTCVPDMQRDYRASAALTGCTCPHTCLYTCLLT